MTKLSDTESVKRQLGMLRWQPQELHEQAVVFCEFCGKPFRQITKQHLEKHNLDIKTYKEMFPEAKIVPTVLTLTFIERNQKPEHSLAVSKALKEKYQGKQPYQLQTVEAHEGRVKHHWSRLFPEKFREWLNHPKRREWSLKAYKSTKSGRYEYDNETFMSQQEMLIYFLLRDAGLSREEINHDFNVGDCGVVDFFPFKKLFWEHHPQVGFDAETSEEYYLRRRSLLDEHGYKGIELIVTVSLDINEIEHAVHRVLERK